jgi:hypothetical protein
MVSVSEVDADLEKLFQIWIRPAQKVLDLLQCFGSGSRLDPNPDWIRIQAGQWIRIRNSAPDSGGQKFPTKLGKDLDISCFKVLDVLF